MPTPNPLLDNQDNQAQLENNPVVTFHPTAPKEAISKKDISGDDSPTDDSSEEDSSEEDTLEQEEDHEISPATEAGVRAGLWTVCGGATLTFMAVPLAPVAVPGAVVIAGGIGLSAIVGYLVGKKASAAYAELFGTVNVNEEIQLLAYISQKLYKKIKKIKPIDTSFLAEGPSTWILNPEKIMTQFNIINSNLQALRAISAIYQDKNNIQVAIHKIKTAIQNGPSASKFKDWWNQPSDTPIVLAQLLEQIGAASKRVSTQIEEYINPIALQKKIQTLSRYYEQLKPYRLAFLKGVNSNADNLSNIIVNSFINSLILEASIQSKKAAQVTSEKVVNKAIDEASKCFISKEIYQSLNALGLNNLYTVIQQFIDPNQSASSKKPLVQINQTLRDRIQALVQETLGQINSEHEAVKFVSYNAKVAAAAGLVVSTAGASFPVAYIGVAGATFLPDILAPLAEEQVKTRLATFFSTETNQQKINQVRNYLVEIIKLSLVGKLEAIESCGETKKEKESEKDHSKLESLWYSAGQKAGQKLTVKISESINKFALKRYQQANITQEMIQPGTLVSRTAGAIASTLTNVASSTANYLTSSWPGYGKGNNNNTSPSPALTQNAQPALTLKPQ